MAERVVAAFDFDGTITRRDTVVPFLAFACGRVPVATSLAAVAPRLALAAAGRASRDEAKEALLRRVLAGRDAGELATAGRAFAARIAGNAKGLRAEVLDKVAWHRDQGHELVLVSASLATYLDPLAPQLGFDAVLLNTAVAQAADPVMMATAFAQAISAGHAAYQAGPMQPRDMAAASTPVIGKAFLS